MANESTIHIDVVLDDDIWSTEKVAAETVRRAGQALLQQFDMGSDPIELAVLMTSDARMRELNAQFRNKDQATNVLSFPSGENEYIGDIALGVETVVREASEMGVSVVDHVAHLVIHGLLHLLGHDHQSDDEAEEMEQIEVSVLKDLGIANPYLGRELTTMGASSEDTGERT